MGNPTSSLESFKEAGEWKQHFKMCKRGGRGRGPCPAAEQDGGKLYIRMCVHACVCTCMHSYVHVCLCEGAKEVKCIKQSRLLIG